MGVEPCDGDGSAGHERLGLSCVRGWGVWMAVIEARAGTGIRVKRKVNNNTFRFNSKFPVLKLLYNLARLCEGTHLQPLRLKFFGINFPSYTCSQLPCIFSFLRAG